MEDRGLEVEKARLLTLAPNFGFNEQSANRPENEGRTYLEEEIFRDEITVMGFSVREEVGLKQSKSQTSVQSRGSPSRLNYLAIKSQLLSGISGDPKNDPRVPSEDRPTKPKNPADWCPPTSQSSESLGSEGATAGALRDGLGCSARWIREKEDGCFLRRFKPKLSLWS